MMIYQVCYNHGEGRAYIAEWPEESGYRNQYGHFTVIEEYDSREEAEAAMEDLRGEPVYALFDNVAAGQVFVTEEDNLSGNWKGSKYGYFCYSESYNSREEAEQAAERRRNYYAKLPR